MELKVFYGIRKTTRVAIIADVHEAIEVARNIVNVIVLPPMLVTLVIRKAIKKRFQLKVRKKYTNQPESLRLKKIFNTRMMVKSHLLE